MIWKTKIWKIIKWTLVSITSLVLLLTLLLYIFEDKICNAVLLEVGKEFREPVYFESADVTFWSTFPNLAVNINQVRINDAYISFKGNQQLLKAKRIRLVFNPWDLWKENYHIKVIEFKQGELNLRTATNGENNYNVLKATKNKSNEPLTFSIGAFRTVDFNFNYLDSQSNQFVRTSLKAMNFSGNFQKDKFAVTAKGDLNLNQVKSGEIIMVNNKPVKLDISANVNTLLKTIQVPICRVQIAEIPFLMGGAYSPDSMRFDLNAKALPLAEVVNKLSIQEAQNELVKYKGSGKVDFSLVLTSDSSASKPNVLCNFKVTDGYLQEPLKRTKISKLSLEGSYKGNGNPKFDQLLLNNLEFATVAGHFSGNPDITDFMSPRILGKAKGGVDLSVLNTLFKNEFIERIQGVAKLNTEFDVQLLDDIKVKKVNGSLSLNKVWFKARGDQRTFENINGDFTLKDNHMDFVGATLTVNQSDMTLDGRFKNIYNYCAKKGSLTVDCAIKSQRLLVEDLGKTSKEEKRLNEGKQFVLPKNIEGKVNLQAQRISYESHLFENLNGTMVISPGSLNFPSLTFRNGQADMHGNLNVAEDAPEHLFISSSLQSQNIDFKPLFKEWHDFDQTVVTSNQISGLAKAEINFNAPFDLIGGIDLNRMNVTAHLKVENGALHHVQAFDEIANSINTKTGKAIIGKRNIAQLQENIKDIKFKTLENTIKIEQGVVSIPMMKVESSALNLEMSGTHTFDQQIDYRLKFNFRELLGEDRDAEFGTVVDDGTGFKIYLRMYGHISNPKIEWDKSNRKEEFINQIAQEKATVKSILKTELGLFKKDSTVKEYKSTPLAKEKISIHVGPQKNPSPPTPTANKPETNKENKLKTKLNQWKTEQRQDNVSLVVKKG